MDHIVVQNDVEWHLNTTLTNHGMLLDYVLSLLILKSSVHVTYLQTVQ